MDEFVLITLLFVAQVSGFGLLDKDVNERQVNASDVANVKHISRHESSSVRGGRLVHDVAVERGNESCNETLLQSKIGSCCWCRHKDVKCVLFDNLGMNFTLFWMKQLNYTFMERMTFLLNNSWMGHFPEIDMYRLDLSLLEHFTELRHLRIEPSKYQTHLVPLAFTDSTFEGCRKIEELHVNIPLEDTDQLGMMIKPLKRLKVLDFNNVRSISHNNMAKTLRYLPHGIEALHLSHFQSIGQRAYLTVLQPWGFFKAQPFVNLTEINLSDNGFALIYTGWYNATPNLKYLDVSHNGLTYSTNTPFLLEAMMHPSMEILNISHQGFYDALNRFDHFHYEPELNLSCNAENHHTHPNNTKPEGLFDFHISQATIKCVNNVTHGNFSRLFDNDTDVFCNALRVCSFSTWKYFACDNLPPLPDIFNSSCEAYIEVPIGRKLREVYFTNSYLDPASHTGIVLQNTLCFVPNNSLTLIDYSSNYFWANNAKIAESISSVTQVSNLDNLRQLNLNNNDMRMDMTKASVSFQHLNVLNMSRNYAHLPSEVSLCADKSIHGLTELDLSFNRLNFNDSWKVIENCKNLTRLNLAGNNLTMSLFLILKGNDNLKFLNLASNRIEKLSNKLMDEFELAKQKLEVNISNNPLVCGCKSLDFVKWVKDPKRRTIITGYDDVKHNGLKCSSSNGEESLRDVDYHVLWKECTNFWPVAISVCVSVGTVLTSIIIACLWKKRFLIQYKYFTLGQWCQRVFGGRRDNDAEVSVRKYDFDAFVSYSSEDRFWVHDVLMKTLEETYGFKLFIHYRDILPGRRVQLEIDEHLSRSRQFILVISKNFLDSEWCQTEMEGAYRASLARRSYLAVIVLGNVPTNIENATARTILEQHNYLQWRIRDVDTAMSDPDSERRLFWKKLVHHLYGNPTPCCCCCCPVGPRGITPDDVRAAEDNQALLSAE